MSVIALCDTHKKEGKGGSPTTVPVWITLQSGYEIAPPNTAPPKDDTTNRSVGAV